VKQTGYPELRQIQRLLGIVYFTMGVFLSASLVRVLYRRKDNLYIAKFDVVKFIGVLFLILVGAYYLYESQSVWPPFGL